MAISLKELIGNTKFESLPKDIQDNINDLLPKINALQEACIKAGLKHKIWIVTSGLRTKEDHIRIYKQIASKKKIKFDEKKIPWGSQHLTGGAIDISDPKLEITEFLKKHPDIIKEVDLYFEDGNANWVHAQIKAPKSGKRWFYP
jgi:LAS superfamily LD-carboxypeptidase LdcB